MRNQDTFTEHLVDELNEAYSAGFMVYDAHLEEVFEFHAIVYATCCDWPGGFAQPYSRQCS